jgi:hypothetical protein
MTAGTGPLGWVTRRLGAAGARRSLGRCPVCHRHVAPDAPAVRVHGLHVHRECAPYRPRPR